MVVNYGPDQKTLHMTVNVGWLLNSKCDCVTAGVGAVIGFQIQVITFSFGGPLQL